MLRHGQRLISSFALLVGLYWAYALVVVPIIEPEASLRAAASSNSPAGTANEIPTFSIPPALEPLFPREAWERKTPKILETDHATLLFQDYSPQEDGKSIELRPITLILRAERPASQGTKPTKSSRAFVLQAPEGAVLHFDEKIDFARAKVGKLIGGHLKGEVTIRSPETALEAGDEVSIVTRNIQIERERIWTPHEVRFQFGRSHGQGRDLSLQFNGASGENRSPLVGGLRSVELVHVDGVHVVLAEEPDAIAASSSAVPAAANSSPVPAAAGPAGDAAAQLDVHCDGRFRFDLINNVASFDRNVRLAYYADTGPPDQLWCEQMQLFFERGAPGSGAAGANNKSTQLNLSRFLALGEHVRFASPTRDAEAHAQEIEYHLTTRRLRLEDARQAMLRYGTHHVAAPQLEYQLQEQPERLGVLWASGPGRYWGSHSSQTQPGKPPQEISAEWQQEVQLRPFEGNQVLSLYDGARIGAPNLGEFSGDELHFYLLEQEQNGQYELVPDKILGLGHVHLDSPQLQAETRRLEIWLKRSAVPAAPAAGGTAGPTPADPLAGLAGGSSPRHPQQPSAPPAHVTGDQIYVQMLYAEAAEGSPEVKPLTVAIEGHVHVKRPPAPGDDRGGFEVLGDKLEMNDLDQPEATVRVEGQPAEIRGQGLGAMGGKIEAYLHADQFRIFGPGEMRLAKSMPQGSGQLAPHTTVKWQTGMHFDGQSAHYEGPVEVHAVSTTADGGMLETHARGPNLAVTLSRPVEFTKPNPPEEVQLRELRFPGRVFLESRQYGPNGVQRSYEKMDLKDLYIDQFTGALRALGPGWLSTVRYTNNSLPGSKTAPQQPSAPSELIFLRVDFQREAVGNLHHRDIRFTDDIRAVYGPVGTWNDELQLSISDDPGPQQLILTSDSLTIAQMESIELTAEGDTRVEGDGFEARGHRISYSHGKDLLVLEGNDRIGAQLAAGPDRMVTGRMIQYWPKEERFFGTGIQINVANPTNTGSAFAPSRP